MAYNNSIASVPVFQKSIHGSMDRYQKPTQSPHTCLIDADSASRTLSCCEPVKFDPEGRHIPYWKISSETLKPGSWL